MGTVEQHGQSGDQRYENVAGRDVHQAGIPWQAVLQRLDAEVSFRDGIVAAYRQERDELRARLDRWERDQALYRELDHDAREQRQAALDRELAALRREQARTRRWVVGLALGLLLAAVLLALLYVDRYAAATLLRLWFGAGLALLAHLVRP